MTAEALEAGQVEKRRLHMPSLVRSETGFDVRNTWQIIVGALLIPAGLIVILIAWYGAAHARVEQQQIPYLVSGSFIGLGLMTVGGLMFWAHWLYRIYDQADLHHRELLDALTRLQVGGDGDATTNGAAASRRGGAAAGSGPFVATGTGTNFHRPGCTVVTRRGGGRPVSKQEAASMQACRICDPLAS
jgi:hypothetical protein